MCLCLLYLAVMVDWKGRIDSVSVFALLGCHVGQTGKAG